jgi:hypothetical protein
MEKQMVLNDKLAASLEAPLENELALLPLDGADTEEFPLFVFGDEDEGDMDENEDFEDMDDDFDDDFDDDDEDDFDEEEDDYDYEEDVDYDDFDE